jgi:hypothetical protein
VLQGTGILWEHTKKLQNAQNDKAGRDEVILWLIS